MTRDEALTRHLAEKVMGWKYCGKLGGRSVFDTGQKNVYGRMSPQPFDPLHDANDALRLLEGVKTVPQVCKHLYGRWSCYLPGRYVTERANTPTRAICEAVGKATGFEENWR